MRVGQISLFSPLNLLSNFSIQLCTKNMDCVVRSFTLWLWVGLVTEKPGKRSDSSDSAEGETGLFTPWTLPTSCLRLAVPPEGHSLLNQYNLFFPVPLRPWGGKNSAVNSP